MPRSVLGSLTSQCLVTTAVLCASVVAFSAPSARADEAEAASAEQSSAAPAAQPQDSAVAPPEARGSSADLDDRSYLLETASPGDTMMRQGPEVAIRRLNPEFVTRLAGAIREAREAGLPKAGIFSAYRPPGFGIGGFSDKFNSLHAYGLAVDMSGIGEPGSKDAKLWHDIAGRHGVFCPYGADNKKEWNHCQATPIKKVTANNPLRATITAQGPTRLEDMFKVGSSIIDGLLAAITSVVAPDKAEHAAATRPHAVHAAAAARSERRGRGQAHQPRGASGTAVARLGRRLQTKTIILANVDARHVEKSSRKTRDDAKADRSRKTTAASAESRHDSTRRRSRSALVTSSGARRDGA